MGNEAQAALALTGVPRLTAGTFEPLSGAPVTAPPVEHKSPSEPSAARVDPVAPKPNIQPSTPAAVAQPAPSAPTSHVGPETEGNQSVSDERVRPWSLLGIDEHRRPVRYDTAEVGDAIGNYNIMISGSAGNGKTQLIKSMAVQLASSKVPSMFVDFKNDFAGDPEFLRRAGLEAQWIAHDGLPYNPLIPGPTRHPGTGAQYLDLRQHLSGVQAALQQAYGLGDQQTGNTLRGALRDAFLAREINPSESLSLDKHVEWPDFNDIAQSLEQRDENAFTRLAPLFDLGIFRAAYKQVSFASILERRIVLDLSQVQSEKVKMTLAHLILYSAHGYLNAQNPSPTLRHLIVFDEAHRVLTSSNLEKFARECRAYGVALLLSSQNPGDFPPPVKSNLATKILFGNGPDAASVAAIRTLAGLTEADSGRIASLGLFQAVVVAGKGRARMARMIGYAQWVVWRELKNHAEGLSHDDLEQVPGILVEMLDNVLKGLLALGLVEEVAGRFLARDPR